MQASVRVSRRYPGRLAALERTLLSGTDQVVERAAERIAANAQRRIHVITGHMRASTQPVKIAPRHWKVEVGADYGVFEEYGTRHRPGHPAFVPAVAEERARFFNDVRQAFRP